MSHESFFPRNSYSGNQQTKITAFHTTTLGEYVFGGEKMTEKRPYLGYNNAMPNPQRNYEIQFALGGDYQYIAAAKLTNSLISSLSSRAVVSLLCPATNTDDISLLVTNPWNGSTFENLGLYKIPGFNDKRRMVSNNNFVLLDSDMSSHHEVKAIMANEDDDGKAFNVFLVAFKLETGQPLSITTSKKLSSAAITGAPAQSFSLNFVAEQRTVSGPSTHIIIGGPCYFQKGHTYTNCMHQLKQDLSTADTATTATTVFRNTPELTGYVETLDFLVNEGNRFLAIMSQRPSYSSSEITETSEGFALLQGCLGISQFVSGRVPYTVSLGTREVLSLHLASVDYSILYLDQGADMFILQGRLAADSESCAASYTNQFAMEYKYHVVFAPPTDVAVRKMLVSSSTSANEFILGFDGLWSNQKEVVIFDVVQRGDRHSDGMNTKENMQVTSYSAVSGTDIVGFFSSQAEDMVLGASDVDALLEGNTCSQWIYNPSSSCNTDLSKLPTPPSILLLVGADINGEKTIGLFPDRLASADSSKCPLNCCFIMDQGCNEEVSGLDWLSHLSSSSAQVVFNSTEITSGKVEATVCLKCNNEYMEVESDDFTIGICYPIGAINTTATTIEKAIHLAYDEELNADDARFHFPALENSDCQRDLTYTVVQSGTSFNEPVLNASSGEYYVGLKEVSIPLNQTFNVSVTDGHLVYQEQFKLEITQDDPPPPPPSPPSTFNPFAAMGSPRFGGDIDTVTISLEQEFEVSNSALVFKSGTANAIEVALPEILSASGDSGSSNVELSLTTVPALADPDLLQIDGSVLEIDLSKFSALDYSENSDALRTQALGDGSTLEALETLFLEVTLVLEEEGVRLKGETSFQIEVTTSIIIKLPEVQEDEEKERKQAGSSTTAASQDSQDGSNELEAEVLTEEEEAQLVQATEAISQVTGVKASPRVPFFILKFFADMLAQEQMALAERDFGQEKEIVDPPPLTAWVEDISTLGLVDIEFSHPLDKALFKAEFISDRTLSVTLEQSTEVEQEPNSMTWELVQLSSRGMRIQLGFENAILVSSGVERDILNVEFENNFLFRSQEHQQYLMMDQISTRVPGQLPQTKAIIQFDQTAEAAAESFKFITIIILLGQYVMKGLLKKILTAILALQIVVVYGKLGIKLPANIVNFLQKLAPFISFDLLKILSQFTNSLFTFDMTRQKEMAEDGLKPALQDMGYKTFNAILNLGSLVAMLAFILIQLLLLSLALASSRGFGFNSKWLGKMIKSKKRALFFSQPLTLALSGFMPIYTSVILCMQNPLLSASGEVASVALTVFELIPLVSLLGVGILFTLFSTQKMREDPDFKQRWGRLYAANRQDTRLQLSYFLVFVLRRWIIIKAALSVQPQYSVTILQMMLVTNMLMTIYLGHTKPKPSRFENRIELANDLVTTIAGYHLITFTEFTLDPELKFSIGWSFIGWIGTMLVGNFSFVLFGIGKSILLLSIKYRRLYQRYGISMKPRLHGPIRPELQSFNSISSILTSSQMQMVEYYQKHQLDLPQVRDSITSVSAVGLEKQSQIFSIEQSTPCRTSERSSSALLSDKQPPERSRKKKPPRKSQFKKLEDEKKLKRSSKKKESADLEEEQAVTARDAPKYSSLDRLLFSPSSKASELSSFDASYPSLSPKGMTLSKKLSGVDDLVRTNTMKTPQRKNAVNLSVIREESNLSMDRDCQYSFFAFK